MSYSYCRQEGKDRIIFVTEADDAVASKVALPEFEDEAEYEGLIKADGEINWECPCLGGMATGICGEQFRSAFSCFHHSQSELKGSECIDQFRTMQECFNKYPDVYGEFESVEENDKNMDLFSEEDNEKEDEKKEQGGNVGIRISVDKEEEKEPESKSKTTITS